MGIGLLIIAIGVGIIIAGYIYPNDSSLISKAIEDFEEKQQWVKTTKNSAITCGK